MGDKIRTALFNSLGNLDDLTLLDAFAGSGAISFEAISRGASHATAIDSDKNAYQALLGNVKILGLNAQVRIIHAPANSWSQRNPNQQFDIVVCDPPYQNLTDEHRTPFITSS